LKRHNQERSAVPLTYKEVAEIIKIIDASNLDELVIEMDGAKMHIRRNAGGGPAAASPASLSSTSAVSAAKPVAPAAEAPAGARSSKAATPAADLDGNAAVRSPMVGVFYRAPSPKDPPFVEVGSKIKRGDPLCLIEVMKLFTTITADRDGRISQILPANGDLVEFDQILFVVEPA
jgi:acetyl-CoA carboxylase biotin carboxyl carrier protein